MGVSITVFSFIFNTIVAVLLGIIGVLYIVYGYEQHRQEEMKQAAQNRFSREDFFQSYLSIIFGSFSLAVSLLTLMKVMLLR